MARIEHDCDDIPGTFVFVAERSSQAYGVNMSSHVTDEGGEPQGLQGERGGSI
jgi:hypothetical protein